MTSNEVYSVNLLIEAGSLLLKKNASIVSNRLAEKIVLHVVGCAAVEACTRHEADVFDDWKVLKIFQHTIQHFYSDDYTQAVDSFKNSFKKFLNNYSSPDKRVNLAIEKMKNNVSAVLASKPAHVVFEKRENSELEELYGAHTKKSVLQDKITLVDSTTIIDNNAKPSTSTPQPVHSYDKRASSKPNTRSKKKTKRLKVKDIKLLPLY